MVEYKIWCDNCDTWTDDFETEIHGNAPTSWICCKHCGNGLVMVTKTNVCPCEYTDRFCNTCKQNDK
jgi:hypothetical protein